MQKKRTVWFREFDGWWYGQFGYGRARRRERLVKGRENRREAVRKYKKMLEEESAHDLSNRCPVRAVFIACLRKHSKKKGSPETHAWYRYYLKSFAKKYGKLRVS